MVSTGLAPGGKGGEAASGVGDVVIDVGVSVVACVASSR